MIDDGARRAVALRNGHAADGPDVDEQVLDGLTHQVRAGKTDDRLMKGDVRIRVFLDVIAGRGIEEFVEHGVVLVLELTSL